MIDAISNLKNKLKVKYFIYLPKNEYRIYDTPFKVESTIPTSLLDNKLYEVIEENVIDNEKIYLISSQGNELGWVTVNSPVLIMNSYPEKVIIKGNESINPLSDLLGVNYNYEKDKFYTKRYVVIYEDELYYGITLDNALVGFIKFNQITDGKIKPTEFKFKSIRTIICQDIFCNIPSKFFTNDKKYECDYVFNFGEQSVGSFKLGKSRYWFDLKKTDLEYYKIQLPKEKSLQEVYLEHIFYTQVSGENYNRAENGKKEKEVVDKLINDSKKEIENLKKICKTNEKLLDELKKENVELVKQNQSLDEVQGKNKKLNSQLNIKNEEIERLSRDAQITKEYIDILKEDKKLIELKFEEKNTIKSEQKNNDQNLNNMENYKNKINHYERMVNKLESKIEYYTERNTNLENKVETLSTKLKNINDRHNKLKESKLGSLQLKYWNRKK